MMGVIAPALPAVSHWAHIAGTRHPSSDGAHRLAWYLASLPRGSASLSAQIDAPFGTVTRLLSGELEPGDEMAARIAIVTGGYVVPGDWRCGGPLGWTDRPFDRHAVGVADMGRVM